MKILICDDHALFRDGLRNALAHLDADVVETEASEEALARVEGDGDVDLVLLDLNLPEMDGREALRRLRESHPEIPVVVISATEEPDEVQTALGAGASGFIPKSSSGSVLRGALELVFSGSVYIPPAALPTLVSVPPAPAPDGNGSPRTRRRREGAAVLTPRQIEVLQLVSRGLTNREIADVLEVSAATVKTHVQAIFEALDVTNRTEASLVMRELGLDPSE